MKKTQRIDLLTTIRDTIVSFFAITVFVALGVGLFLGIHWVAGSMHGMAADAFRKGRAHDVEISFPYGFSDDDIAALNELEDGNLEVEASYLSFQQYNRGSRKLVFRVGTLPASIDTFIKVDGTLPTTKDQIALDATLADKYGFALGDTIEFVADGKDGKGMRYLHSSSFEITAFVLSPAFLAQNSSTYGMSTLGSGTIDALSWVAPEAFDETAFLGSKPYCVVRSAKLSKLDPFSEEYKQSLAKLEQSIVEIGEPRSQDRIEVIRSLAKLINDERTQKLENIVATYTDITMRYDAGVLDEAGFNAEIDALGQDVMDLLDSVGINLGVIDHNDAYLFVAFFEPFRGILGDGTLQQIRQSLTSIVDYAWIVLSRTYNGAVVLIEGYTGVTDNLRWSMASLFLVVGILVCYSAISRTVHKQLTRIGTKKALGFLQREISSLFLCYAALCVFLGLIAGVLIAVFIVERILLGSLTGQFVVDAKAYVNLLDIILIGALEAALILGATWFAVSGVLKRNAQDLLVGERPMSAKARFYEEWSIWQHMSLLAQTTVNNCINDRRRVVGTLIGIAGCTALISCAITLNDNVMRSFDRQYSAVLHYDALSNVAQDSDATTKGVKALSDAGMDACPIFQRSLTLRLPDNSMSVATITVPTDQERFERFVTINPVGKTDEGIEGVWVSEAYRAHMGAQVGDVVTLVDIAGNKSELPIAGFFEWHLLSHEIIVPQKLYESSFDAKATANKLLIDTHGKGGKEAGAVLRRFNGYQGTNNDRESNRGLFTAFSRIARIVVAVYLALAVVMAACVLLNLDFMFVDEKKRELIVLMICGYSLREAKGYVWHDSVALTVLGILLGLMLGGAAGSLTVLSIEQANASFLKGVSLLAVGIATGGTILLSGAAMLLALRRIDRFDLTDINRF